MNNVLKGSNYVYIMVEVLWVIITLTIFIGSKRSEKIQSFKDKMVEMWKYCLFIAVLSFICRIIGNKNLSYLNNILASSVLFCKCSVGFAIAKSISGYEPLTVTKAFLDNKHKWRKLIMMFVDGIVITIVIITLNQIVPNFGEVNNSGNAVRMLPQNKCILFFILLSGAGIAEETVYRLVFLSLFWRLTNNKWVAIVLSALLFAAYHFTPLNALYKVYWGFPIHQFVSVTIGGLIFGYVYTNRGYETAVVGHTFVDWLPILIFMK